MRTHRIIEYFDVVKHVLPGFWAHFVGSPPDALALER